MNFIEAPLTTGIVFYFVYMTFELFVRKQERINLIEKMGHNLIPIDQSALKNQLDSLLSSPKKSFSSLRIGCLLTGLGLGLFMGLIINVMLKSSFNFGNSWWESNIYGMAYGSSVMFFGGLGLLISYLIENKSTAKTTREN